MLNVWTNGYGESIAVEKSETRIDSICSQAKSLAVLLGMNTEDELDSGIGTQAELIRWEDNEREVWIVKFIKENDSVYMIGVDDATGKIALLNVSDMQYAPRRKNQADADVMIVVDNWNQVYGEGIDYIVGDITEKGLKELKRNDAVIWTVTMLMDMIDMPAREFANYHPTVGVRDNGKEREWEIFFNRTEEDDAIPEAISVTIKDGETYAISNVTVTWDSD